MWWKTFFDTDLFPKEQMIDRSGVDVKRFEGKRFRSSECLLSSQLRA